MNNPSGLGFHLLWDYGAIGPGDLHFVVNDLYWFHIRSCWLDSEQHTEIIRRLTIILEAFSCLQSPVGILYNFTIDPAPLGIDPHIKAYSNLICVFKV